jgi:di/tricarboxylate transporter
MSFRNLFRIVLIVILLALAWRRMAVAPTARVIGYIVVALVLLLAVVLQLTRKQRKLRDEVPKRPLGLDS